MGGLSDWNDGKLVCSLFGELITEETKIAPYFQYYLREDDRPKAILSFMSQIVDAVKEPKREWIKWSDREPFNWLPKL